MAAFTDAVRRDHIEVRRERYFLVALTGDLPSQDGRFPLNFRIGGLLFILSVVVDFLVTMILIQIFYSN